MASVLCLYGALHCLVILPAVSIDSEHAHDFLAHARPRRTADPNWYHNNPDFQSYYRYYSSIGHTEGLYEIDKIRMLYQQMRHLELAYGPDAFKYQNSLGLQLKLTPPPPTLSPVSKMDVMYLCNSKDPQCKPHIVYLPAGGVPKSLSPPVTASEPVTFTPPPPPSPMIIKGMEYDWDPYWDPDLNRQSSQAKTENKVILNAPVPTYDPYDFSQDLYDPFRHAAPTADLPSFAKSSAEV
uniref:Actinodin3 n=1 Tax=Sinocyclocheilus grahami TaxID=75366 RepID=A0A672KJM6_SINGR